MSNIAYTWEQRLQVVATYMLHGNMRVVSEQHNIEYSTLMDWKRSDWWPEMVESIRRQKKGKTSQHISQIVEQSLDALADRLENGDYVLNNKTGEVIRKPVSAKDANSIAAAMLQRQQQLDEFVERGEKGGDSVKDTLDMLAKEFQKWNRINNGKAETIEFKEQRVPGVTEAQQPPNLLDGVQFPGDLPKEQ